MEIARLEVSTQHHLDRMQETAKVYSMYSMEKSTKNKKGKKAYTVLVQVGTAIGGPWNEF